MDQWATLNGGMPQGTRFGPYVFLMLTGDWRTILDTFKFVDDITLSEVVCWPVNQSDERDGGTQNDRMFAAKYDER